MLADLISREGRYVNDPDDAGGPTKFGVTQGTLAAWRKKDVSASDVEHLSATEALSIYRYLYVEVPGFSKISDDRLRALVVDSGVQHGISQAVRMIQRALGGLDVDGVFGPRTLTAIENAAPAKLWLSMFGERLRLFGRLITNDPTQAKFAAGWMGRMAGLLSDFTA